jgi:hypothetical protein
MPTAGQPTGPRPIRPVVQPGQTAAQPGAGSTTGVQPGAAATTGGMGAVLSGIGQGVSLKPSGVRPQATSATAADKPLTPAEELAARFARGQKGNATRPQPVTPGKPGAAAPAQAARPRVMRGVQEEWNPAVTMPMGNVNWNNYLPYNDDSFFNPEQNVMYSQNAAGQAINLIKTILNSASYSKEEGLRFTDQAAGDKLKAALADLNKAFVKPQSQVQLGVVTQDKRQQLLDALFVAITIAPHEVAHEVVKHAVAVIALENEYTPGTIFSYLADMYVGSAVNALRTEINTEIRAKAT